MNTFRGGNLVYSTVVGGRLVPGRRPPHGARESTRRIASGRSGRRTAPSTRGGRGAPAHHFGTVSIAWLAKATAYQLAALAFPNGSVAVYVDTGSTIERTVLLPEPDGSGRDRYVRHRQRTTASA